ncbi:hypothetical protein D9M69_674680 [compost metagenome]
MRDVLPNPLFALGQIAVDDIGGADVVIRGQRAVSLVTATQRFLQELPIASMNFGDCVPALHGKPPREGAGARRASAFFDRGSAGRRSGGKA